MPSDPTVTRVDPDDPAGADAVLDMDQLVWADDLRTPREAALRNTPTRAAWIARIDGEDAGIAASWDIEVSFPTTGGASLRPVEGLTWVGVHPDHRRRGVLTALMREHLRWTGDEAGRTSSSPTSRKKMAISASLTQWASDSSSDQLPSSRRRCSCSSRS